MIDGLVANECIYLQYLYDYCAVHSLEKPLCNHLAHLAHLKTTLTLSVVRFRIIDWPSVHALCFVALHWPLVNMKQTKRSAEEMPQDGLSRSKSLKMSEANVLETDAARSSTNSTKGLLEGLEPSDVSSSKLALILTHASSPVELFGQCSSSEMIERIFAWFGDGTMDIPWYIPGTNPPQQSIVSSMHNRQLQD